MNESILGYLNSRKFDVLKLIDEILRQSVVVRSSDGHETVSVTLQYCDILEDRTCRVGRYAITRVNISTGERGVPIFANDFNEVLCLILQKWW